MRTTFDAPVGFFGGEAVDDVPDAKQPARTHASRQPHQGSRLPEVGHVMKRVARVGDIDGRALVLVRNEAGFDGLHVVKARLSDLRSQTLKHGLRDVSGDHARASGRDSECELARAGSQVEDRRTGVEPERLEQSDFRRGVPCLFGVVARDMIDVEVLAPGAGSLIKQPPRTPGGSAVTTPS